MTFEDAVRKAIKAYWKGDEYDNMESFKNKKYNKKYFDSVLETDEVEKEKK